MAVGEILRFATAGSVDDGKSSLIGRLLFDTKSILEDQLLSIEQASRRRGSTQVELALLTDGLRAEREQNITIDVAYRYFATAKRKFIIADTPGHLQYTRNMVTGTSTADLSVILIDARKGVQSQSKRHAAISALLGIRHLVVAVNKMDLVEFEEGVFDEIAREFGCFAHRLGIHNVTPIPLSALLGDNVVEPSANMAWYTGPTLLEFLESVETRMEPSAKVRLPIQFVIRPNQDYRAFAGRLESGRLRVGDGVRIAPNGLDAVIRSLTVSGRDSNHAVAGQAISVTLDREIDVSRGDLLYSPVDPPTVADRLESVVCWMDEKALQTGTRYLFLHGSSIVSATVERVVNRVDVDSLESLKAASLAMNDIGNVLIRTSKPIAFDRFADVRATGSFVLVDPGTHATVAAGMIHGSASERSFTESVTGKVYRAETFSGDLLALVDGVNRFGKRFAALTKSDFADSGSVTSVVAALVRQGLDVLLIGLDQDGSITLSPEEVNVQRFV